MTRITANGTVVTTPMLIDALVEHGSKYQAADALGFNDVSALRRRLYAEGIAVFRTADGTVVIHHRRKA